MTTPTALPSQRPHLAAAVEDRFYAAAGWLLHRLGWRPRMEAFTGYGSPDRVRVLARVLLSPQRPGDDDRTARRAARRGFRHFLTVPAPRYRVQVQVGAGTDVVTTDRAGYVDVEVRPPEPLRAGWQEITLTGIDDRGRCVTTAPLLVVDDRTRFGVVSDIDDTTMVTAVPRPLLAAWNTFVRHAGSRRAVEGMPELYQALAAAHPDAPFLYLSTGAWNTAATLRSFLGRHGYPTGPLLLTDWGPTLTGWFRSGQAHKNASLDLLMARFPHVRWLLVGDDGQHDAQVYARAVDRWPGRVEAVAIRRLTPGQQVLAGNVPAPERAGDDVDLVSRRPVPTVEGRDGHELATRLAEIPGVLAP
ncbi:App1 family protein [Isoptericola hypogeus]|uniref:App1 family protein n=1 Tax=Isoptericola hypogeus TaxID=300179 RepID=A0ABN2JCA5_9MICO